jgi:hypothetical protein
LAKKSRTPPPPRRVQAPAKRVDKRVPTTSADRRARLLLLGFGISGIVALAVVIGVIFATRSSGGATVTSYLAPGCRQKTYPILQGIHVTTLKAKVRWNSFPPTSGPHYYAPAPWNFYDQRINPRITLHNLEHGGIDIFYGSKVLAAQIDALRTFWQRSPNAMLVAPMPAPDENTIVPRPVPDLSNKIVLAAWTAAPYTSSTRSATSGHGYMVTCSHFDEKTFASFRDAHRGKGPERFR